METVCQQVDCVVHTGFAAVLRSWITAHSSLHSISFSWWGWAFLSSPSASLTVEASHVFKAHLNTFAPKLVFWLFCSGSPQALLRLRLSEASTRSLSFIDCSSVKRDLIFLILAAACSFKQSSFVFLLKWLTGKYCNNGKKTLHCSVLCVALEVDR